MYRWRGLMNHHPSNPRSAVERTGVFSAPVDAGVARLAEAWKLTFHHPGSWQHTRRHMDADGAPPADRLPPSLNAPPVASAPPVADLLVALLDGAPLRALPDTQTVLSSRHHGVYRIRVARVAGANDDIEGLLREHAPRVLLIDARLVERCGVEAMRRLHRHQAACDWLLGWDAPSLHGFELALQCQARGCVARDADGEHLGHALDAVLAGELWFPRRVMDGLYLALLDASRSDAEPGALDLPGAGLALTVREAQVLALMREGLTNRQIAERLLISINTVKKHLEHAFEKRGLHGRRQALR
jgi:DNA-binding NarL/FixJ family response regulator